MEHAMPVSSGDFSTTVTIQSTQRWQITGVSITGTQATSITCSGQWTTNPAKGWFGPEGSAAYTAPPGYTLPHAAEGALIGRVDTNAPFVVGNSAVVPEGQTGVLSLCINDDLDSLYGMGLGDNAGFVIAVITTTDR